MKNVRSWFVPAVMALVALFAEGCKGNCDEIKEDTSTMCTAADKKAGNVPVGQKCSDSVGCCYGATCVSGVCQEDNLCKRLDEPCGGSNGNCCRGTVCQAGSCVQTQCSGDNPIKD